ncbi:hypothetical protein IKH79_01580 [Candidatus Saccharibacteria bacterium]|nr:hypothetical protein [Candidatus Saccharibacteria bacterium]
MKNMIKMRKKTHLKRSSLLFSCIPLRTQNAIWRFARRFKEWPYYVTEYDVEGESEDIHILAGLYLFRFEKTGMVLYLRIYGGQRTKINSKEYYTAKAIASYPDGTYCLLDDHTHSDRDDDYLTHCLIRGNRIVVSSTAKGRIHMCVKDGRMINVHSMGVGAD